MDPDIMNITLEAMRCNTCFEDDSLKRSTIDLAQPRWVGPAYWFAKPRIVILLINPGAGSHFAAKRNHCDRALLHEALRSKKLDTYLAQQRRNLGKWGRGKFWKFFFESELELNPDAIALANIALCASRENRYPNKMLTTCFEQFSRRILFCLNPDVVLLCGSAVNRFRDKVQEKLPSSKGYSYDPLRPPRRIGCTIYKDKRTYNSTRANHR